MVHTNLLIWGLLESLVLVLLLRVLVWRRTLSRRVMIWSVIAAIGLELAFIGWVALDLWWTWHQPDCKLCYVHFPPYSDYWYRLSFYNFGSYFGVNTLTGLLVGFAFWVLARRTEGEVIDRDDVFLLTLCGLLTGWPNILLFLGVLFVAAVLIFVVKVLFRRRISNPRVVITPFIPLAGIPIVLWGDTLARWLHFYDLGLVAVNLTR